MAYRKVCSLKDAGADVIVVSPDICPEMADAEGITLINTNYDKKYLEGALLVIAATDNEAVNEKVALDAGKRNLIVNVVDRPELCSFIVPSTITRGELCISISTGGASPAVAKKIRKELETIFGAEYEKYLDLLTKMRSIAMSDIKDSAKRRKVLRRMAEKDILDIVKNKGAAEAETKIREIISKYS